jgi:peptidoglycan/LPS O-acetylase OafA/YrhL
VNINNKVVAFYFLRALAIIMIIPAHLSSFLFSSYGKLVLYAFDPFFANMGLGLFIFMSGYLLYYNNHSINSLQNILSFYKKRVLRIFPLYWAALAVFVLVYHVFAPKLNSGFLFPDAQNVFSFSNILVHILGLQIFLAPTYASPMLTLYFIGLLIIFYALYPFIIMFSKSSKHFIFISSILFIGFILISRTFNIIDPRFFMFFPVFVFGVFTCKQNIFEKSGEIAKKPLFYILLAAFPIIFVLIVVLQSRTVLFLDPKVSLTVQSIGSGKIESSMIISMLSSVASSLGLNYATLRFIIDTLLLNIFIFMFCTFEYRLAMQFIKNNFSSSFSSLFTYIATSSYCVYLFHRPFLTLWNAGANFISNPILHDVTMIFVALPILFFISYQIQMFELNLMRRLSDKKGPVKEDLYLTGSITGYIK